MDLSISIVSWNVKELLEKCLNSIFENHWHSEYEVFVVDNASSDGTVNLIKEKFPQVKLIINSQNLGFAKANNIIFKKASGRYFLLLNPDTILQKESLNILIDFLEKNSNFAAVTPKLLNKNGTLQKSCLGFPTLGALVLRNVFIEYIWPKNPWSRSYLNLDMDYDKEQEIDQPMGAAILLRREIFEKMAGFDENTHLFFDEVDLCYRIKKDGGRIFYLPQTEIIHLGGESIKKWSFFKLSHNWNKSRDYFFRKHFGPFSVFLLHLSDLARILIILAIIFLLFRLIRIVF